MTNLMVRGEVLVDTRYQASNRSEGNLEVHRVASDSQLRYLADMHKKDENKTVKYQDNSIGHQMSGSREIRQKSLVKDTGSFKD